VRPIAQDHVFDRYTTSNVVAASISDEIKATSRVKANTGLAAYMKHAVLLLSVDLYSWGHQ